MANTYEGYTCEGVAQTIVTVENDAVVNIYYAPNSYKLSYESNSGSYVPPVLGSTGRRLTPSPISPTARFSPAARPSIHTTATAGG